MAKETKNEAEQPEQPVKKVNIDGKEYDLADLSDEAQAQVQSLQFVEVELARANAMVAVMSTAKAGYQRALKEEMDK